MISTNYLSTAKGDLKQRMITAAIILPIVLAAILLSKTLLLFLVLSIYGIMQYEVFSFSAQLDRKSKLGLSLLSFILPLGYAINGFPAFVIAAAVYLICSCSYLIFFLESEKHAQIDSDLLLLWGLSLSYTGLLGTILYIVACRFEPNFIIWLIAITIFSDTFAYFFGKYLGNKKLAPRISPGKTIVGLGGGIFGALIAAAIIVYYHYLPLNPYLVIIFSLIMSLVGVFGDLFESLIKRCYNRKDSGNILPGHGGILDRVDALIFTAPLLLIIEYFLN